MEIIEEYEPRRNPQATKVFLNGVWVGVTHNPKDLCDTVLEQRRKGPLSAEISLVRDIREREFKIFTDAGRVLRPVFTIDNDADSHTRGMLTLSPQHLDKLASDPKGQTDEKKYGWSVSKQVPTIIVLSSLVTRTHDQILSFFESCRMLRLLFRIPHADYSRRALSMMVLSSTSMQRKRR